MSILLNFGHAMRMVEFVHVMGVVPDDRHIDDQRSLGRCLETERPAKKDEIQVSRKIGHDKGHHKPHGHENGGDVEVLLPILPMVLGDLHACLLC
jgi:hypothetical protein